MELNIAKNNNAALLTQFQNIRNHTELICAPLQTEDYVVQPVPDVSPPKWHLGHTTWFFEYFILKPNLPDYREFDRQYDFVFNSYYETIGARVLRTDRGNLSRPSVDDVYRYRAHIDRFMEVYLRDFEITDEVLSAILLGLNHEQQHQELLITDIKYILGHNPLFPALYTEKPEEEKATESLFVSIPVGVYEIGYEGNGFCFDNEMGRHKVYVADFEIATTLVSNGEYLQFMESGGYSNFEHWHAEGWEWVKQNNIKSPLYWHFIDGRWMHYTLFGLQEIERDELLCHVSFYEAAAFASWKKMRLPTEAEWEITSQKFKWGQRWEWTNSAYLPYPGYKRAEGAIGEYNGKFMVNQMVLRGGSVATPDGHTRNTYRNFFHPWHQWQFSGIRLVQIS